MERERVVRQKVAASTFARGYLSGIVNTVFDQLQASGVFYDPLLREVEESFMPWLQEQAVGYLAQGVVAREVRAGCRGLGHSWGPGRRECHHVCRQAWWEEAGACSICQEEAQPA